MIQRHLRSRVLAIAGAAAAITLGAVHAVPAAADGPETIEVNASATAQAVRLTPPTTTTPR